MAYPLGNANGSCWNSSNINCTDTDKSHNTAQCSYGCVENAAEEISAMSKYDEGMRLLEVGFSGFDDHTPQADMKYNIGWKKPSAMGGGFSAMCWCVVV